MNRVGGRNITTSSFYDRTADSNIPIHKTVTHINTYTFPIKSIPNPYLQLHFPYPDPEITAASTGGNCDGAKSKWRGTAISTAAVKISFIYKHYKNFTKIYDHINILKASPRALEEVSASEGARG